MIFNNLGFKIIGFLICRFYNINKETIKLITNFYLLNKIKKLIIVEPLKNFFANSFISNPSLKSINI